MIKDTVHTRPILFSGPMVRAILDGRKTQTRRVITKVAGFSEWATIDKTVVDTQAMLSRPSNVAFINSRHCSYGQLGDRLWVRETFVLENCEAPLPDRPHQKIEDSEWGPYLVPHYRATEPEPHIIPPDLTDSYDDRTRWSPSIFMPRWASRITLEVTGIRIEKVQDISPEDAGAEGITINLPNAPFAAHFGRVAKFGALWDSLNAKRGYGWELNPWVWVVEFRQLQIREGER